MGCATVKFFLFCSTADFFGDSWFIETALGCKTTEQFKPEYSSAATFSIVSDFGDIKPEPDVKKALMLIGHMTFGVGFGDSVIVEKLL